MEIKSVGHHWEKALADAKLQRLLTERSWSRWSEGFVDGSSVLQLSLINVDEQCIHSSAIYPVCDVAHKHVAN